MEVRDDEHFERILREYVDRLNAGESLDPERRRRILDFGLARLEGQESLTL